MNARFSREEAKASLTGDVGYEFDLSSPFEAARSVGGLASSARSFVNSAIKCFLVGYDDPGYQLLEKAEQWLEAAIESNEQPRRYFEYGTEAIRLYDLALCRWLAHNAHDIDSLTQSINFRERYFDKATKSDRVEFVLVLPEYLDAGRFDEAMRRTQGLWKSGRLPPEVEAAAAIANGQGEEIVGRKLIDSLLGVRIPEWLARGHFDVAAKWLKVAHWLPSKSRSAISIVSEATRLN